MNLRKSMYYLIVTFVVAGLTVITQIGGIVLIFSIFLAKRFSVKKLRYKSALFLVLYLVATWTIVPVLAQQFGREKIKHVGGIAPVNYMTVLLNRNFVRPQMNDVLASADKRLQPTGIQIQYLDAGFPFVDGFPLLPHLSHNDGKKLDISLIYQNKFGELTNRKKSFTGYGVFVEPLGHEVNQTNKCKTRGYDLYDFPKYLAIAKINTSLEYSNHGTRQLMMSLLGSSQLGKVFIEPHLKERLNIADPRIRFHGCGAVRHDDHIHIQLK